jgi:hypothetical protein
MNTTENNKLLAEFMGRSISPITLAEFRKLKPRDKHLVSGAFVEDLQYHSSWNYLMEVVEKIEDIETIDVDILTNGTRIYEWRSGGRVIADNCANISFDKKIEHTYDSVVEFVQWYNKNK